MPRQVRLLLPALLLVLPLSCSDKSTSPQNHAPTITDLTLGIPPPIGAGYTVDLNCTASDPDGDALAYTWSAAAGVFTSDATKSAVTWRAPQAPCQCTVTVTVSDGRLTAMRSVTIPVGSVPVPKFTIEPPVGTIATTFSFDAGLSEDLTTPANELEVRWNMESSWSSWSTDKVARHQYAHGGSKMVTLEVRNRDGLVASRDSTFVVGDVPFVIENLGIRFEPFDPITHQAGDFVFIDQLTKVFWEFGAPVKDEQGQIKELPHVSYVVRSDASVAAVAEGEVVSVTFQQESNDYEVSVRSVNDPSYEVLYDHLVNLTIGVGARIHPGDALGNPRGWIGWEVGDVEIMVLNRFTQLAYCPFVYFNETTRLEFEQRVSRLMSDWEAFKGDGMIYDEGTWAIVGCRYESIRAY